MSKPEATVPPEVVLARAQAFNITISKHIFSLIETTKAKGAPNAPTLIAACEMMLRKAWEAGEDAAWTDRDPVPCRPGNAIMFRSQRKAGLLDIALANLLYEVTHLSPRNEDGSHNCKISAEAVMLAREALNYAD